MAIVFVEPWLWISTWRSRWPADELERRGWETHVIGRDGEHDYNPGVGDVMIIHVTNQDWGQPRKHPDDGHTFAMWGLAPTVRHYKKQVRRVLLNFDDDYTALGDVQELGPWVRDLWADHAEGIRASDGLIASTPQVAEAYAKYAPQTWVVRNWLPRWVTEVPVFRKRPPMAGWFGTISAHRRDLEWLAPAAKGISRLGIVGEWWNVAKVLGRSLDWHADITFDERKLYALLSRFSVGIAPVVDDRFNRAKSWIKPLEFGALGIPCVASRVEPYKQLLDESIDERYWRFSQFWVVRTPEEMVEHVNGFLDESPEKMAKLSELLREDIRDNFTLEGRGGDEWEAMISEADP